MSVASKNFSSSLIMVFSCLIFSNEGSAKVSEEAEELGGSLTFFGAERKGNNEGTIPIWNGGLTAKNIPSRYNGNGEHHPDPYDDKIKFTIDSKNYLSYKDKLTDGQVALLEEYPDSFKMLIYPTRRSLPLLSGLLKTLLIMLQAHNLCTTAKEL